jgi:hypothetical protein
MKNKNDMKEKKKKKNQVQELYVHSSNNGNI